MGHRKPITKKELFARTRKENGCWIWIGYIDKRKGYGKVTRNYKLWWVHRLSYFFIHGEIPNGKEIAHKCNNPACINPNHLYAATRLENLRDARIFGAWKDSEERRKKKEKTRVEQVVEFNRQTNIILKLRKEGMLLREIGAMVRLSESEVCRVVNRNCRSIPREIPKHVILKTDFLMPVS